MRRASVVLTAALAWGLMHGCADGDDERADGGGRARDAAQDAGDGGGATGPRPAIEQSCSERYELLGDLAIDRETRLTWTRFVAVDALTHEDAAARCAGRGMRLPTRPELSSIMLAEEDPARECRLPCVFEGHRCATLICGTPIPGSDDHWGVTFLAGAVVPVASAERSGYVCVR